jgi:hypothetical protein
MSESAAPARAARISQHLRLDALRQINDARIDWQLGFAVNWCSPSELSAVVRCAPQRSRIRRYQVQALKSGQHQ